MVISLKPTEYQTMTYFQHTRHVCLWTDLKYLASLKQLLNIFANVNMFLSLLEGFCICVSFF